ncbi:MAG: response regulator [Candidatus Omnitrophica bacterium]|nr:response regulator [Candidatus Omnitrophota bacterium]
MSMRRVLVVDDENLMRDILLKALSSEQVDVVGVSDGIEALQYVQEHPVDLIISDVMMPKMQGTELFFEVRKLNPFVQVIIMTGYPTLETITRMLEAGVSDFIIKPFRIDRIRLIVTETLGRIERWKQLAHELVQKKRGIGADV